MAIYQLRMDLNLGECIYALAIDGIRKFEELHEEDQLALAGKYLVEHSTDEYFIELNNAQRNLIVELHSNVLKANFFGKDKREASQSEFINHFNRLAIELVKKEINKTFDYLAHIPWIQPKEAKNQELITFKIGVSHA